MCFRKRCGFTLIELLVVISIVSLLMSILLPSLRKAREQAKRVECMSNLRSIGQGLYIYAQDHDGRLVQGDCEVAWDVWSKQTDMPAGCESPDELKYKQVNLGYLMTFGTLPVPNDDDSVVFCPSSRVADGGKPSEEFIGGWESENSRASITYMFNNSLDGFDNYVQTGEKVVLSHKDKINYFMADGSSHSFNVKKLIYDDAVGPELVQEVSGRYGVCFPTIMLHDWLSKDRIDLAEAKEYLASPQGWANLNRTDLVSKPVLLANVAKKSLICDVVGVWSSIANTPSPPPPPGGG